MTIRSLALAVACLATLIVASILAGPSPSAHAGISVVNVGILWFEGGDGHAGIAASRQSACKHDLIDFGSVSKVATRNRFNAYVAAAGSGCTAFNSHAESDLSGSDLTTWNALSASEQADACEAYGAHYSKGWTL